MAAIFTMLYHTRLLLQLHFLNARWVGLTERWGTAVDCLTSDRREKTSLVTELDPDLLRTKSTLVPGLVGVPLTTTVTIL